MIHIPPSIIESCHPTYLPKVTQTQPFQTLDSAETNMTKGNQTLDNSPRVNILKKPIAAPAPGKKNRPTTFARPPRVPNPELHPMQHEVQHCGHYDSGDHLPNDRDATNQAHEDALRSVSMAILTRCSWLIMNRTRASSSNCKIMDWTTGSFVVFTVAKGSQEWKDSYTRRVEVFICKGTRFRTRMIFCPPPQDSLFTALLAQEKGRWVRRTEMGFGHLEPPS